VRVEVARAKQPLFFRQCAQPVHFRCHAPAPRV
jgi:hypothetical protein